MRRRYSNTNSSRGSGRSSQSNVNSSRRSAGTVGIKNEARRDGTALIQMPGVYNYAGPKGAIIRLTPATLPGTARGHHDQGTSNVRRSAKARNTLRGSRTRATRAGRYREHLRNQLARKKGWALPNGKLPIYLMTPEQRHFFETQALLPGKTNREWLLGGNVPGSVLMPQFRTPTPAPQPPLHGGTGSQNYGISTDMGPPPTPKPPGAHPGKPVVTPTADPRVANFLSLLHRRAQYGRG